LPLEVVDRKNFTAEFYHLKVKNPIGYVLAICLCSKPPIEGKGEVRPIRDYFVVFEKPIPTFLLSVY